MSALITLCTASKLELRERSIGGWINEVLGKGRLGFYGENHSSHLLEFFMGGQRKSVHFACSKDLS